MAGAVPKTAALLHSETNVNANVPRPVFDAFAGTSGQPAAYGFIHPTKVKDAQSSPVSLRGDVLASSNGNECTMVIRL